MPVAEFLRFCVAGGIGFVTDFLLLHAGLALGLGPLIARFISATLALLVTWQINRRFTFRVVAPPSAVEATRYMLLNGTGFALNLGVYTLCVLWLAMSPSLSIVVASAVAMLFNFAGNRYWVFRGGVS